MKRIAIIGAGISGLTAANIMKDYPASVTVYEKELKPGGLIRCERVEGSLFHICGGHVFNTKNEEVLSWFWNRFDKSGEFTKADRNSVIFLNDKDIVPYPIENHLYYFDKNIQEKIKEEILSSDENTYDSNFKSFLQSKFGNTLYEIYFGPYNEKVWKRSLEDIPLSWLEGKLPMPGKEEILFNNEHHVEEKSFVHSSFWYERESGSQYIADKLAAGLDIRLDSDIKEIEHKNNLWIIDGEEYEIVLFCGNVRQLPSLLKGVEIRDYIREIEELKFHGTTSVFCEVDVNPYSWIYLPDKHYQSHRIICTGNFANSNNAPGKMTATVEFTDYIGEKDILSELSKMPLHPKYLAHHYSEYSYPIQSAGTRDMIRKLKERLSSYNFYLSGRFADWEYYNMDAAMLSAMTVCKQIFSVTCRAI